MRKIALFIPLTLMLSGCSMFEKEKTDELELMTETVLKHHRGIKIDIEPGEPEGK